jgi:hypothetical protein
LLSGEGRCRDGHSLELLLAALGSDDDLFQLRAGGRLIQRESRNSRRDDRNGERQ